MLSHILLSSLLATQVPSPEPTDPLAERVAALEAKVAALEAQLAALPPPKPGATAEAAANLVYQDAAEAFEAGRFDDTRALLARLDADYPGTRAHRMGQRILGEVAVIGRQMPEDWADHVETWLTRPRRLDLAQGVVVALYWEVWCPHCKREVPKWEQTWQQYRGEGLQVVGFTRITRSSTLEQTTAFIAESGVTYPMAREDGRLAELADVSGIPAAAVLLDGEIIWRGHPARITDAMLTSWLQLP